MFFDDQLKLLRDTLKKCRVNTAVVSPLEPISAAMDVTIRDILLGGFDKEPSVQSIVGNLESKTMYRFTDEYKLCYTYLRLPYKDTVLILFVGPYMTARVSSAELFELGEKMGVSPKAQKYLDEFYSGIPVLTEGDAVFVLLDTFCEHIWEQPSFAICDANKPDVAATLRSESMAQSDNFDDELLNIKTVEKRYEFENGLIEAVARGQIHKEKLLSVAFSEKLFEKRVADPLRNAKNYGIIMNTLLRKAAEQGRVHPFYIDKMSSDFAVRIEQMSSVAQSSSLMKEMFRSYCKLVRKHSVQNYSLTVQKTILMIDLDLSADLSLSTLAKQQNISSAYLSALFKRETGKTLSEYIRDKRIEYAAYLLSTTHLQVQTVALHCGIMDVQYFSKIFKKQMGKTPKEYRESMRTQ
jgi:AraC-like DNA-binding protein